LSEAILASAQSSSFSSQGTTSSNGTTTPNTTTANNNTAAGGNNTTSPGRGNLTAIGESIGRARIQLLEGCNAVNNGNSKSALMHFNLAARSLDNIEDNLTSNIDTEEENTTTSVQPTGGTSASSVGNTTKT
jgi:hypothetical protein